MSGVITAIFLVSWVVTVRNKHKIVDSIVEALDEHRVGAGRKFWSENNIIETVGYQI